MTEEEIAELKIKIKALESANKAMVKEIDDMSNGGIDLLIKIAKLKEENEQLKQQSEKEKKFIKDVMNNELRLIKQIEKMKSDVMSDIKWAELPEV